MKIYIVFQRFIEDREKEQEATLLRAFLTEENAKSYIEELFEDWFREHTDLGAVGNLRDVWEDDFETYVKEIEVEN